MYNDELIEDKKVEEFLKILNASCAYVRKGAPLGAKNTYDMEEAKPSIEEASSLKLKPLSSHLRYTF